MKSLSIALLLAVVLVACGGSDSLEGVENCSDLAKELEWINLLTSEAAEPWIIQVEELGTEMAEAAIARGAELEAAICMDAVSSAQGLGVVETFEEIGEGLS